MKKQPAHGITPVVDDDCLDDADKYVTSEHATKDAPPLLIFSHLRWHFITQRPQHLLLRAAQSRAAFYWEEPCVHPASDASDFVQAGGRLEFLRAEGSTNITVVRPHFYEGEDTVAGQRHLLNDFLRRHGLMHFDRWYYTPMALSFSAHLDAEVTVFDCMDELSAFLGAPIEILERERELFRAADVVFTGGRSIFEAKRNKHANVHLFPSSIDVGHFSQTKTTNDPDDQSEIAHPRAGFFGAIDERFDAALISKVAALRPEVQFIFIGPVVKIDPATLPQGPNLHFLGLKPYSELPAYLKGWDAALLPFAINDSTRFISPTKTPEYLAAGKRVVSTAIRDVVAEYGEHALVEIASTAEEFCQALDRVLVAETDLRWKMLVERKLASSSWERTWAAMNAEMEGARARMRIQAAVSLRLGAKTSAKKPAGSIASGPLPMLQTIGQAASQ